MHENGSILRDIGDLLFMACFFWQNRWIRLRSPYCKKCSISDVDVDLSFYLECNPIDGLKGFFDNFLKSIGTIYKLYIYIITSFF